MDNVIPKYKELTGNEISPGDVYLSLIYAERLGLVKKVTADVEGYPIEVWKGATGLGNNTWKKFQSPQNLIPSVHEMSPS